MVNKLKMDKCSFCGREKKEVNLLIAGIDGHICDHACLAGFIVGIQKETSAFFPIHTSESRLIIGILLLKK